MRRFFRPLGATTRAVVCLTLVAGLGCGGSSVSPPGSDAGGMEGSDAGSGVSPHPDAGTGTMSGNDAGESQDAGSTDGGSSEADGGMADGGAPEMYPVSFSYRPSWSGVTAVSVIGGFHQAQDWKTRTPLLRLLNDGSGTYSGTTMLPAGKYPYLFVVTGDANAAHSQSYARLAMDPMQSYFVACPPQSPSFTTTARNPCSLLHVPLAQASAAHQVQGTVTLAGQPVPGWIVQIERDEPQFHTYFDDETVTGADGTYQLSVATGHDRIVVACPSSLMLTDAERMPLQLQTIRDATSSPIDIAADSVVSPVEVGYADYPQLSPMAPTATLPVKFGLTVISGATSARVAVYGVTTPSGAVAKSVGDPWYLSTEGTATSVTWKGGFNSGSALEARAKLDEQYYWGTWQTFPKTGGANVVWTAESMVFPLMLK